MTGSQFKDVRGALGLSQAKLAAIIGGRASLISDYENEQRAIPKKLALLMCFILEAHQRGANIETVAERAA